MKKTKVVIPALGIIAFATAASITGTVAWFTASRSAVVTAGEFAVINTKDNLSVSLAGGVGTSVNATPGTKQIDVTTGYKLTDGSVDHTNTTKPNIIAPDADGHLIEDVIAYDDASLATKLVRDDTNHIYTAFTWDMTFSVRFAGSQTKKLGLFLEPGKDTWMHEVVHFTNGEKVTASNAGTYFVDDPTCTAGSPTATFAENDTITSEQAAKAYYKAAPDDTGKAFSIAFIPLNIPTGSYGYSKIWAENREDNKFIDFDIPTAYDNTKSDYALGAEVLYNNTYYKALVASPAAGSIADATKWGRVELGDHDDTAIGTTTTKMANNVWAAETGKALMNDAELPDDGDESSTSALSGCGNYMGYFGPAANQTINLTYRCVAYYEGTDSNITAEASTIYETMTTSMKFTVVTLSD